MRERASPRAALGSLREHWPDVAEAIKVLPVIARRAIRRAYDDEIVVRTESESLEKLRVELSRRSRRSDAVLAAGIVFLGGIVWISFGTQPGWIGWVLAAGGGAWLVRAPHPTLNATRFGPFPTGMRATSRTSAMSITETESFFGLDT